MHDDATNDAPALAVLGAGNMGSAILRGAIESAVLEASRVVIVDPSEERRAAGAALGCRVALDPAAVRGAPRLMLAVKPQVFPDAAAAIGRLDEPTEVISIMAGITSASIRAALGEHARVVRAMPNTPARLGRGMTAVALGDGATESDAAEAERIFASVGATIRVDESQIDAVTAVSGSGPAYVFLLAEAMERGARAVGFDDEQARQLVARTIAGAAALLDEAHDDPVALRAAVTSRGGTTAAAVATMIDGGMVDAVERGVIAARDRGRELGGG